MFKKILGFIYLLFAACFVRAKDGDESTGSPTEICAQARKRATVKQIEQRIVTDRGYINPNAQMSPWFKRAIQEYMKDKVYENQPDFDASKNSPLIIKNEKQLRKMERKGKFHQHELNMFKDKNAPESKD